MELGKHYKSIGQLVEAFDRLMTAQVIYEKMYETFPTDHKIKKIVQELDKLLEDEIFDEMYDLFEDMDSELDAFTS